MKTNLLLCILPLFFAACFGSRLLADDSAGKPVPATVRALQFEDARKQQIRNTMIGFTSTRIFYTFDSAKAVLVIHIDNQTADFGISGSLVLFAPDADAEGVAKWVNNQHSCGLFIDPAEPTSVHPLPDAITAIIRSDFAGEENNPIDQAPYADYKLRIAVREHHVEGQFKLHGFEDNANVYLKVESL
ncbi:MAG: hypothetical protein ACNA8L_10705 [Luteolibacter sp.]